MPHSSPPPDSDDPSKVVQRAADDARQDMEAVFKLMEDNPSPLNTRAVGKASDSMSTFLRSLAAFGIAIAL